MEIPPEHAYIVESSSHKVARTTFVVICSALIVALVCMLYNVYRLQTQVATLQVEVSKSHGIVLSEITKVRELSAYMSNTNRRTMKGIREELEEAKQEVVASAGQARMAAEVNVQRLAHELRVQQQRQRETQEQVKRQLADAHQATVQVAATTDARIADVKTEVGSVKHDVAQAQTNLNRAVSDLRRMVGDMGVMSGLIATNQRELDMLRSMGERRYTAFRIVKAKEPQLVNGVGLALRRTDPGNRRFTIEVVANDVRVEKRDKTVNEPVQFYISDRRQPYEIVVNSVTKNEIAGYLASPGGDAAGVQNKD